MVDYIKAINSGIYAAKLAKKAREEIREVIGLAATQIAKATGDTLDLAVTREVRQVPRKPPTNVPRGWVSSASLLAAQWSSRGEQKTEEYSALTLKPRNKDNAGLVLCTWIASEAGYPIKLQFSKKEVTCRDKRSLEQGIVELLSDPGIGFEMEHLLSQSKVDLPHSLESMELGEGEDEPI